MWLVRFLPASTMTMAMIIATVSMVTAGEIIVASVVVVALVEAVAVEVLEVAMARRNPPTIIPTSTVDTVKEWVMIFVSAGSMPQSKRRERRTMWLAHRVEATRLLVRQDQNSSQINSKSISNETQFSTAILPLTILKLVYDSSIARLN